MQRHLKMQFITSLFSVRRRQCSSNSHYLSSHSLNMLLSPKKLLFCILLVSTFEYINGAKILFFISLSSHSHRVAMQPLINKLADRNHEVTVFSPIKSEFQNPNVQDYCTQFLKDMNAKLADESTTAAALGRLKDRHFDPFFEGNNFWTMILDSMNAILRDPEFIQWIDNSHFDLIIYDFGGKEFVYPIAHKMNAKVINFMSSATQVPSDFDNWGFPAETWFQDMLGNSYSFLPDRYFNTLNPISWHLSYHNYYLPKVEALVRDVFKFDFPPLEKLVTKIDLVLLNEHHSIGYARSYPPFVIPVGGMHVKESNGTLPKGLEEFIAGADKFVYISFGSIFQVSKLPNDTQQTLFDAVASIPNTRFLWKWEGELPGNLPPNARAKNWFPQQDVLANPKCKGFVTQGGAMSFQQSVFHGVPIVVVPGFGDQAFVAKTAVHHGIGIHLELSDITVETFSGAIRKILEDEKYSKAMNEVSSRFRDRPLSAVDTGVWWTEYVLRHDTSHLRSEALRQTWWERRSLDLWFIVFSLGVALVIISAMVLMNCLRFLRETPDLKVKQL